MSLLLTPANRSMKMRVCDKHERRVYDSFNAAIHACLASSRVFGKGFRAYKCDVETGKWHVTSEVSRSG